MFKAGGRGFTIVELLIAIVVIAILAAVTVVAYNGVTRQARESTAKLGASQASQKVKAYSIDNADDYPTSLGQVGIDDSESVTYIYSADNDVSPATFCVTATSGDQVFHMNQDATGPQAGPCSQHGPPIVNLLPDPSVTNLDNYIVSGPGTGTIAIETDGTAYAGSTYIRRAFLSNSVPQVRVTPDVSVTAGEEYTFSCWTRNNNARTVTARLTWYNSGGTSLGSQTGAATNASVWTQAWVSAAAPENTATVRLVLFSTSTFRNEDTLDVDACMLTAGSTPYGYADGDSPNWGWSGTPHASTSIGPAL